MIRLALAVGWAMTAGGSFGNAVRRLLITRMRLIPGLRKKIVGSRTPALHRSAFVRPTRLPWQLSGTLCPNPVGLDGRRLDEILGSGFAVITVSPFTDAQRCDLDARGVGLHVAARDSELAGWLRTGHAAAAIIRPDRSVMCAGRDLQRLCELVPSFRCHNRIRTHA
jgi:3-(3-hydroxy-phenyl)propionate hydroxylase